MRTLHENPVWEPSIIAEQVKKRQQMIKKAGHTEKMLLVWLAWLHFPGLGLAKRDCHMFPALDNLRK